MGTLTIERCTRLLLLGGGRLLPRFAEWISGNDISVDVVTAPRHAIEPVGVNGESLEAVLTDRKISVRIVERISDEKGRAALGPMEGTLALSLGAAWIFSDSLIRDVFGARLFNLHGTRLPQYRGGGGFSWQILTGNRLGFCVLHRVDSGVDTGDIIAYREFLYPAHCRIPLDYTQVYEEENFRFLQETLGPVFDEPRTFSLLSQPEYLSTYWPRLDTPTHGWIDWSMELAMLERFVCAFDAPYSGAQTSWNGTRVHLKNCLTNFDDGTFHPFQAGIVYRNNGRWLSVAANGGTLITQKVTDEEGENVLPKIKVGDRFWTPRTNLESSRDRVTFTPKGLKST